MIKLEYLIKLVNMHMNTCTNMYLHTHAHALAHKLTHAHSHAHAHTHTLAHAHTHTHTHGARMHIFTACLSSNIKKLHIHITKKIKCKMLYYN